MYWFKIWVEQVCKGIVKAFPNRLYGQKNNESGLLGYEFLQVEVPFICEQNLRRPALRLCLVNLHKRML